MVEAIRAGVDIDTVYVEPAALDHEAIWAARDAGLRLRDTTAGALSKVLDLDAPQQMVAVAAQSHADLDQLLATSLEGGRPVLVLAGLSDPGNVGTLVRVAEAAGCAGVVLGPNTADLFNPKTVRATAGAVFRVPVVRVEDLAGTLSTLGVAGIASVATVGGAEAPPPESVDLTGAVAVVIGNEAHGLDPELARACTSQVRIPMEGLVESLNAAVAGAAVLFDAARQRRAVTEPNGHPGSVVGHNVDPGGPHGGGTASTGDFGDG